MRKYKGEQNYMVMFQEPNVAEALLEANIGKTFENMMRRSPLSLPEFQSDARLRALPLSLFTGEPALMGEPLMPFDELEVFIDAYQRTGFTGGLNWYRALPLTWRDAETCPDRVDVPALMICASDDYFLPPSTTEGMEAIVPDLERGLISSCGHWMQHDQPEATSRIMVDWLERRMRNSF
jgi:pimeloyl-ACP methyl ester carboxylesterase